MNKLKVVMNIKYFARHYSSALYLTGHKAQTTYAVVKPYLDLEERLQTEDLEKNLKLRGLCVNLKKVKNIWNMFQVMDEQKTILQVTRSEIGKLITKLMENEEKHRGDIIQLKAKAKEVKNDYLNVRDYLYGLEETAALYILNLPNVLHPLTPEVQEQIIYDFFEKSMNMSEPNIQIALRNDLLEYYNGMQYFLKNDAALFEFGVLNYFRKALCSNGYTQFSNPDFNRSVVVEGCGRDFTDNRNIFSLEDPHDNEPHELYKLHLVGGASLESFMAYFTKHLLQPTLLPLKLYSCGRSYQPGDNSQQNSLLNSSQETVVRLFAATLDDNKHMDDCLAEIQKMVVTIYEKLGYHFKIVILPANQLNSAETLRLSIQMFSSSLQKYIQVGNVSMYDKYLSKRLLLVYNANKEQKFPRIISGSVVNVHKLLACVLENNSITDKSLLSDVISNHI